MRKTKIICTIGPSCDTPEMLEKLVKAGMNCTRLNFSHGTHEQHLEKINMIKALRERLNVALPILLDTKGPEIRLKDFKDGSVVLQEGQEFTLAADSSIVGDETICGLSFSELAASVKPGAKILIDDGKIGLIVEKIKGKDVVCKVLNGGKVSNHKSINCPNTEIKMNYLSPVDISDIEFGCDNDVDYIAASFTRCRQDVLDIKEILKRKNKTDIKIICKIENMQGINNIDDIIDEADGIMVARGDMGVEVDFALLPAIQKEIISKCYKAGKIVVTATQMLESMTANPRPTRAEVSDVANAVFDRTVATMLSGETASGKYPVEAVTAMSEIDEEAEKSINWEKRFFEANLDLGDSILSAVRKAAVTCAYTIDAKAIVVITKTGITAQAIAAYRPKCPIIAVTLDEKAYRQSQLLWGVVPVKSDLMDTTDLILFNGVKKAVSTGLIKEGDKVIITAGSTVGCGKTDMVQIHTIKPVECQ